MKKLPLLKRFLFKDGFSFLITNASFILASWSDMDFFTIWKLSKLLCFCIFVFFRMCSNKLWFHWKRPQVGVRNRSGNNITYRMICGFIVLLANWQIKAIYINGSELFFFIFGGTFSRMRRSYYFLRLQLQPMWWKLSVG